MKLLELIIIQKETAFDRRAEENEKRKLQKENLKKRFSKMASVAQKIMQPVQSLLDKLINYFLMIFLGNAALKLFDWFTDKENQDKISTIVRFVEYWWPLLLGGYILFGTGLGGLIFWLIPAVSLLHFLLCFHLLYQYADDQLPKLVQYHICPCMGHLLL